MSFLGAVTPVGSKILLDFISKENWTTKTHRVYEFVIDANYFVTGLEITKTLAVLAAGSVPTTGDDLAVEVLLRRNTHTSFIARSQFIGPTNIGIKQIAGIAQGVVTVNGYGAGTFIICNSELAAQAAATGLNNSQQSLLVRIIGIPADIGMNMNPSCFIEVQVAKYGKSFPEEVTYIKG